MARRHHSPEQIIRKLREAEKLLAHGRTIEEICKHLNLSPDVLPLALANTAG